MHLLKKTLDAIINYILEYWRTRVATQHNVYVDREELRLLRKLTKSITKKELEKEDWNSLGTFLKNVTEVKAHKINKTRVVIATNVYIILRKKLMDDVNDLIKEGLLQESIVDINKYTFLFSAKEQIEILALSFEYEELESKVRKGKITEEEYRTSCNKIITRIQAIMTLIRNELAKFKDLIKDIFNVIKRHFLKQLLWIVGIFLCVLFISIGSYLYNNYRTISMKNHFNTTVEISCVDGREVWIELDGKRYSDTLFNKRFELKVQYRYLKNLNEVILHIEDCSSFKWKKNNWFFDNFCKSLIKGKNSSLEI